MIPLYKQNEVIIRNISNTKTDKVTSVTRALDYKIGKIHFIDIVCKVNNTNPNTNLFETGINLSVITDINVSNNTGIYVGKVSASGNISITNKSITTETQVNIFGVVIEK